MEVTQSVIAEFTELNNRYKETHKHTVTLQAMAIEGSKKGVGCLTEENRGEFLGLENEINLCLARM